MKFLTLTLAFLLIGTGAAEAGPVAAAISAVATVIKGSAIAGALFKAVLSIGLSKLAQKLLTKKPKPPGRQVEGMTAGETAGESFVVGRWATGGHLVYHGSFGQITKTPNGYYTRVIELAGIPNHALRSVILNGEFLQFGLPGEGVGRLNDYFTDVLGNLGLSPVGPDPSTFGLPVLNQSMRWRDNPLFFLRFYDGTQTEADPFLLAQFADAERPFGSDMIGAGLCYAVVTYRFAPEVWKGDIEPRFVLEGIPLYDPRLDSSVGGDGPHRHDDPATWGRETNCNPVVIAYNAARGIPLPGGDIYGGEYEADDLPLARWVAAMNVCDQYVSEDRPRRYEFGAEVNIAETEPADLIEACFEACAGQVAQVGGQLVPQVGAPDVPVWSITDDDISADDGVAFEPIKGLTERFNAAQATHVAPAQFWEPRNLPLITDVEWEAEDGGRRLIADLPMSGVYSAAQASELAEIYIKDNRRQRVHQMVLPPDASRLSMFDTITITRPQDGYINKLAEVVGFEQRTDDTFCAVTLREVDPTDYDWDPSQDLPEPAQPEPTPVIEQAVPGFAVVGVVIADEDGTPRRAGIQVTWDSEQFEDVPTVALEFRLVGGEAEGTINVPAESNRHVEPLLPATTYEVRARLVTERRAVWTAWVPALTPDVRLSRLDMDDSLRAEFDAARDLIDGTVENIGGVVGDLRDLIGQIIAPIVGPDLPGVPHIDRIDAALIDEAQARADAITAEAQARGAAVQDLADEIAAEASQRVSDALNLAGSIRDVRDRIQRTANELTDLASFEHLEREEIRTSLTVQVEGARAEYTQAITVLAGEQTAIAQQIVTLEAETGNLAASITAVDAARVDGDDALAAQIALLSVGSAVQFDHVAIWYWDDTVEGWTGSPSNPTVTADGWLVPASASYVISPAGLEISAQAYRQVRARLRNEPTTWSDAWLYWAAEGEGWDNARRVSIGAPDWAGDEAQLTVNPDWTGAIDRVRLDLPSGVEIDWLAIGRPAPGASSADIAAERAARIAGDLAIASDIITLTADLTDAEGLISGNADAIGAITVRVEETEGGIATLTQAQTALGAQVDDLETGLTATGEAVDLLTVSVEQLEDGTSVQSGSIRAVRATQKLQGGGVLDGLAAGFLQDQNNLEVISEASQALNSRIDVTDDQIAVVAEAVTLLQAAIPGLATADAVQALVTRVGVTESEIGALSQAVTDLQAAIPDLAEAQAVQALETRVTATEDETTAQATALTALQSGLVDAEGDISANAGAISGLTTTVTQQGQDITALSSDVTALQTDLTTAEGDISANSGAITGLESTVSQQGDQIAAQASAITDLAVDIDAAQAGVGANAGAITGLTATVTQQGQDIESLSGDVTALSNRITTAEGDIDAQSGALQSLTSRVTVNEADVSSQSQAITDLQSDVTNAQTGISGNATAISGLTTTVTQQGNQISAISDDVTQLQADLTTAEGSIGANATALTGLTARVTTAEGEITSLSGDLTQLDNSLTTLGGTVSANSGAIDSLQTTVSQQGTTITAQGQSITSLQTDLSNTQTDVSGNTTSINTVIGQVQDIDGEVEAIAARTDTLEAQVQTPGTGALARIDTIEAVKVDESGAVAAVNQQISAEYGNLTALAEATAFAEATVGGITSGFVWSLGGDDVLSLVRVDDGSAPTTAARIKADYILLSGDTEVEGTFKVSNINISGDIESDNYAESGGNPTAGFKLERDTGLIKGVDFINRSGLVEGAATDFISETIPGIFTGVTAYNDIQTMLTLQTGSTNLDELWSVAVCGFFRRQQLSVDSSEIINPQIWISRRVKFDGAWSEFTQIGSSITNANGWIPVVFSENFAGNFEDIEYIIEARLSSLGGGATPDELVFRDFAINVQRNQR